MINFNFFDIHSIYQLSRAINLYLNDELSFAARSIFQELVDVSYDENNDRVLFSDNRGNCLIVHNNQLDVLVKNDTSSLENMIDKSIELKDANFVKTLWDVYAPLITLEDKIRLMRVADGYIKSDSFTRLKPFMDYSNQDYSNTIIYMNNYNSTLLSGSSFRNSHITNSSFKAAFIDGVDFTGCVLHNVDFTGAYVSPTTKFSEAILVDTKLPMVSELYR